jgi:hypothetical protein
LARAAARTRFIEHVRIEETAASGRLNQGLANTQAMRNGQNKRMRGRNRKSHNPLTRVYESNGPDVKIRGTPSHIAEKYVQLARDSQTSGDPVSAENYNQHAEHYLRLIAAAQEQFRQTAPFFRPDGSSDMRDDLGDDGDDDVGGAQEPNDQVAFGTRDPQPYLPRDAQFFAPREQQSYGGRQQHQPQQHQPQQHQPQQHQPQQHQPRGGNDDGNVERLPSFITGGGASPGPQGAAPQGHGQNGQNGFDPQQQGDRFPLHRRRRRHRGPRDMSQSGQGVSDGDDTPQGPRPPGE